jgi:hypothetical protein
MEYYTRIFKPWGTLWFKIFGVKNVIYTVSYTFSLIYKTSTHMHLWTQTIKSIKTHIQESYPINATLYVNK